MGRVRPGDHGQSLSPQSSRRMALPDEMATRTWVGGERDWSTGKGAAMKRGRKPNPVRSGEITALERLHKDGADSTAAVRRRIALIAAERNLDPSETNAVLKGRWLTVYHLKEFVDKHRVSVDWLLCGDLKGRLRMARKEVTNESPKSEAAVTAEEFRALVDIMTTEQQQWLLSMMREIVDRPS